MNIRSIFNILAALLTLLGFSMLIPACIALGYGETDLSGFLYSFVISICIGIPIWFFTRKSYSVTNKDGFAIVTFAWIITGIVGALPFYLSNAIPNITDAISALLFGAIPCVTPEPAVFVATVPSFNKY